MMNEVDGMRQEDYSKDWVMHNGKKRSVKYRETTVRGVRDRALALPTVEMFSWTIWFVDVCK